MNMFRYQGVRWRHGMSVCVAALVMGLAGCGGGSGGSGSSGGDTGVTASDLQGTWGGTVETATVGIDSLVVDFDADGNVTRVLVGGVDQGSTATNDGSIEASDRLFALTFSDGSAGAIFTSADGQYAGVLLEDGTVGVLEKDTTSGSFAVDDAVGTWSGKAAFVVPPFDEDGIDDFGGTFTSQTGGALSSDFEASGGGGTCSSIEVSLLGFDTATGVYDSGSASGGTGTDCPPASGVPADTYMSYDANFMVVYAGCEALTGIPGDGCSFAVLSREGSGGSGGGGSGTTGDFSGSWSGSGTQTSDCGDDGPFSGTIAISQSGDSATVDGWVPDGSTFSATVSGDTLSADGSFTYPDGAGETTETGWSATLGSGGDSFSGSSSFDYVEGSFTCSGTLTFSASRT